MTPNVQLNAVMVTKLKTLCSGTLGSHKTFHMHLLQLLDWSCLAEVQVGDTMLCEISYFNS